MLSGNLNEDEDINMGEDHLEEEKKENEGEMQNAYRRSS